MGTVPALKWYFCLASLSALAAPRLEAPMNQGSPLLSGPLIHGGRPGGQVEAQPSLGGGQGVMPFIATMS